MTESLAGWARGATPAVFVSLLFAVSAFAQASRSGASAVPPGSAAAATSGSAPSRPTPSASAAPAPTPPPPGSAPRGVAATGAPPGSGVPAHRAIGAGVAPAATPQSSARPLYGAAPAAPAGVRPRSAFGPRYDLGRKDRKDKPPRSPPIASVDAGGVLSQGLDTTDRATRQGGVYLGGEYLIHQIVPLDAEYSFASGYVTERLPGSRFGAFGVPNDVRQLQSRHAFDVTAGYLWRITRGRQRVVAVPYLGPRLLFLLDDVSPQWAMEAELGARVGLWSGDAIGADAFLAFAPAFARTGSPASVYGKIASELRFGAGVTLRPGGNPLGVRLAYQGDVVSLQHQKLSYHQLLAGLVYAFQ